MSQKPTISVIIPAQNEQDSISNLIEHIRSAARTKAVKQIIVAVNGSDSTADLARKAGAIVVPVGSSRSIALNGGAMVATGDILYFLHADGLPPTGWDAHIIHSYCAGYHAGTFRLRFDSNHPLLKLSAWFTRFSWKFIRYGDQSLFIGKAEFMKAGKFDESMRIMEDSEIIKRIIHVSKFVVLPHYLITSARKYRHHGYWRLQTVYMMIIIFYYVRLPQAKIITLYRSLLGS